MRTCTLKARGNKKDDGKGTSRHFASLFAGGVCAALFANAALAQPSLTWEQVKERFQAANPSLLAGQLNISEAEAAVRSKERSRARS